MAGNQAQGFHCVFLMAKNSCTQQFLCLNSVTVDPITFVCKLPISDHVIHF